MRRLKRSRMMLTAVVATALAGVTAGSTGPAAAAGESGTLGADAPVTVVADELYSPRNLTWGPGGSLLVTEAGTPDQLCDNADLMKAQCFGLDGRITDVSSGKPERIIEGLASNINNAEAVGPNALEYVDGKLYVLESGTTHGLPDWLPRSLKREVKKQYGGLLEITDGTPRKVADPGEVDYRWMQENPEHTSVDPTSNPIDVAPKKNGGFYYVDAAANVLGEIDRRAGRERARVLTHFPRTSEEKDSVPTCVDVGPDGAVYVGELTGYGSQSTEGEVYRYDPKTGELKIWESGFSAITGCGFGANGDFYVTELSTTGYPPANGGDPEGAVIQISEDGKRTTLGEGKLFAPQGFLAGPDGSVYVANNSVWWPVGTTDRWDKGEVVKIG